MTVGVRAGWRREWADTRYPITAQLAEAPSAGQFTVQGTPSNRNAMSFGADARVQVARRVLVYARYAVTQSAHETFQAILGGLSMRW